jgi:hypothetical protein
MASNGQRPATATPHFKERTASVRRKQLLLQKMLLNPRAALKQFMRRQKKAVKKKVTKRVQDTDRAWFGRQQGGNIQQQRKSVNKLRTLYQYHQ